MNSVSTYVDSLPFSIIIINNKPINPRKKLKADTILSMPPIVVLLPVLNPGNLSQDNTAVLSYLSAHLSVSPSVRLSVTQGLFHHEGISVRGTSER